MYLVNYQWNWTVQNFTQTGPFMCLENHNHNSNQICEKALTFVE